jgi:hypothetical protein
MYSIYVRDFFDKNAPIIFLCGISLSIFWGAIEELIKMLITHLK